VLSGALGVKICKNLNITDDNNNFTDDRNARKCLSCHSGWLPDESKRPPAFESGVTCESCHGPSRHWDVDHSDPGWRKKSAGDKEKLGMIDVRDPVRRAAVCYSCHIGNVEEGKFITHEMYAAGHPPLPGIEIETYAEAMPAHWRRLEEKGSFQFHQEYVTANPAQAGDASATALPRTKAVLAGGLVAWRESLRLFAAKSEMRTKPQTQPDYAVYDCQACHHELQAPAWRQSRFERGPQNEKRPGRPLLPEWPRALTKVGLAPLDDAQIWRELGALEGQFQRALGKQPLGGPDTIAAAERATAIVAFLDAKLPLLAATTIDERAALATLRQLYELPAGEWPDFHSARQIGWAIRTIETELRTMPRFPERLPAVDGDTLLKRRERTELDVANYQSWRSQSRRKAASDVDQLLRPLDDYLLLVPATGQKPIADTSLEPLLKKAGSYDPRAFRKRLKQAAIDAGRVNAGDQRVTARPEEPGHR
jgi:hypothetical protein